MRFLLRVLAASLATSTLFSAQAVTTPEGHLGRPVGADFELADWNEVSGYFLKLADESPRVHVASVGQTTEGRDFLLATVSSAANLADVEHHRALAARIADPRGMDAEERERLLADAKPILFVSIAMHSTETAAPQFAMELAYRLATSDEEPYASARERAIVLIAPCLNPDGLDHVVTWYRETVGTPYEAAELLKLYQYYAGHDNNRDWFMLSQNETRIVTRLLYSEWFPQIYWDVHQQGMSRERFFVPPFRDPLNPNLDPGVIAGIGQLGARAMFDMTREGLTGVSSGVTFDMWWNGGNRNVPVRHNVIGLLTEAASVNLASPVFLPITRLSEPHGLGEYAPSNRFPAPWPGGWWRLRDIIDYEHAFARSLLGSVAREPRLWLENALAAAERAIAGGVDDAPRAWVLPSDNPDRGAVRRLVDSLLLGGVELHVADAPFEADGRAWPAGSVVILRSQPYGQHVKDLFEVQRYPDGEPPYDVAGWTLPLLLGVRRVELMEEPRGEWRRVLDADDALALFAPRFERPLADSRDSDSWRDVFRALSHGDEVVFGSRAGVAGVFDLAPPAAPEASEASEASAASSGPADASADLRLTRMPRVGVYAPWTSSMDEGWIRWVFDAFNVPYQVVRNEMVRAGQLEDFLDVLVVPSVRGTTLDDGRTPGSIPPEFARGMGPEGAVAIDDFVRRGGTLIAIDRAAEWAIELFDLPLEDVARDADEDGFACPGSVLRTVPEPSPFTAGLPESLAVFFARSAAWKLPERKPERKNDDAEAATTLDVLLRYPPKRVLLSGWIRAPETIGGQAAWVRARRGDGQVHLFAFRPQYRSWSQGTFELLFRAILFEG